MSVYGERFWKKNWDPGMEDLEPREFETTYVEMTNETFREYPDKTVLAYMGVDITFRDLDEYANRFANMLKEHGFRKGDVVGVNLANMPEYMITVIGALRAGCIISGVSPLLSAQQIQYQLNDLGSGGKQVALVTLDAVFAAHLVKIAPEVPQLKLVVATSVAGFLPKWKQVLGKLTKKVPTGKVTPLAGKTVLHFHGDVLKKYPKDPPIHG